MKSLNQRNQYTAIPNNMIVTNLNWIFLIVMSAMRAHAAYKSNFVSFLDKHSPKKTKDLRGNQKPHFNKSLRKQIMIRSYLKNKANKSENSSDIVKFK